MTLTIDSALIVGLIIAVLSHAVSDYGKFQQLRNDMHWIKAALRHHGIAAPNGEEGQEK